MPSPKIVKSNLSPEKIKQNYSGCFINDCHNKIQAVCFTCERVFCFKCSLVHVQQHTLSPHSMLQIQDSIPQVSKLSKKLLKTTSTLIKQLSSTSQKLKNQTHLKLSPEKFQTQLDQINFMKKQTLKVVEKFFSEISLQLVNIWQFYLKKYSSFDDLHSQLSNIRRRIQLYAQPWNINQTKQNIIKNFFKQSLSDEVQLFENYLQKLHKVSENQSKNIESLIPNCPQIRIDDRVLVQLSQVLCSSISTKNFSYEIQDIRKIGKSQKQQKKLQITLQNYLHKSVTWLPIFPIKKNHCFLYNVDQKSYQIQQFDQLQYIPDYPKTIILPNGDIHIVGGTKNDHVIDTHLVFRASSSEVFKLPNLPYPRNPSNSLVYHNKHIYLIGGLNEKHQWDQKCFKYSLQSKQWRQIVPMSTIKPHQSCSIFNNFIYCFGIPQSKKINIEKYVIEKNIWQDISITNFLSNPFNFSAGFTSCQINDKEIILFGGKKFLQSVTANKRSTDRTLQQNVYVFQPQTNSFLLKGPLYPCLGVQYGQFYPIIFNNKIISPEYILCKTNPISRWYDNLQVLQINQKGDIESAIILEED